MPEPVKRALRIVGYVAAGVAVLFVGPVFVALFYKVVIYQ